MCRTQTHGRTLREYAWYYTETDLHRCAVGFFNSQLAPSDVYSCLRSPSYYVGAPFPYFTCYEFLLRRSTILTETVIESQPVAPASASAIDLEAPVSAHPLAMNQPSAGASADTPPMANSGVPVAADDGGSFHEHVAEQRPRGRRGRPEGKASAKKRRFSDLDASSSRSDVVESLRSMADATTKLLDRRMFAEAATATAPRGKENKKEELQNLRAQVDMLRELSSTGLDEKRQRQVTDVGRTLFDRLVHTVSLPADPPPAVSIPPAPPASSAPSNDDEL